MEFGSKNIARLVLGYLKEEKLRGAYDEMLVHSPYLQDMRRNEMKFYTRVNGMTLIDFLLEYETVYTIIQKHLECTDYFKEKGTRTPLTKQLQYLLTDNDNLTSTLNEDGDRIEDANIFNEVDPIPSNSCNSNSGGQNYATSSPHKTNKSSNAHEEINFDELLAQTFLNNSGLIEKLTDSINQEVTDKSIEEVNNLTIGNELNKNKINAIAQRFVENPAMVKVLNDMTRPGSDDEVPVVNALEELDRFNPEEKRQMTPKKTKSTHSSESIKKRLRSNRKISSPVEDCVINEQNEDAIKSIIAAASTSDPVPPTQPDLVCNEVSGNVLIDNSTFVTQPLVNPLYLNAIMVQSNNTSTSNFVTSNVLYLDSNPQQAQFSITNQELVNIPMIICDDQEVTNVQSTAVVPRVDCKPQNCLVKLAPKPTDSPMSIGQFVTLYKSSEDACDSKGVKVSSNLKSKAKKKSLISNQIPASSVANQISASSIANQISASSIANQISASSIADQIPASSIAKQTLASSIAKQTPDSSLAKQTPIYSIAKQTPAPSITKQTPASAELPKASVSFELPTTATHSPKTSLEPSNASKTRSLPPILTPKSNSGNSMEKKNRTTPRNGSHVRQLKFSSEDIVYSPRHSNVSPKLVKVLPSEQKTIKTKPPVINTQSDTDKLIDILEDNQISNKTNLTKSNQLPDNKNIPIVSLHPSWDADLRNMMSNNSAVESEKPPRKTRRRNPTTLKNTRKKQRKINLNSTEEDAEKIELALVNIGTKLDDEDYVANLIESSKSPVDNIKARTDSKEGIEDISVVTNIKTDDVAAVKDEVDNPASEKLKLNDLSESTQVEQLSKGTNTSKRRERSTSKGGKKGINNEDKSLTENLYSENDTINNLVLLEKNNLNLRTTPRSKIKSKCNMQNAPTNSFNSEEIVLTSITKIKSCKVIDEGHKLILSPSKLCPTKRNLESRSSEHKSEDLDPLITPELSTASSNMPLLAAKRDLMPLLETPMKSPSLNLCPITPGTYIPSNDQTPFTKALIDQCSELDLGAIPTPKFPITPNFPFTPALESRSPFPNRPTDYSTCSSYYQPSDTEHSKSLDNLIEECKRLEDCKKLENGAELSKEKCEEKPNKADFTGKLDNKLGVSASAIEPIVPKLIREKSLEFRKNLIAKKDLQLIKPGEAEESSSSSSSSSTSSSSSSEDDTECDEVVPTPHYSLRSRKPVVPKVEVKREMRNRSKETNKSDISKAQLANHKNELEAKRQRIINSIKEDDFKSKPQANKGAFAAVLKTRRNSNKSNKVTPKRKKPVVRKSTSNSKIKKVNVSGPSNKSNSQVTNTTVDKEKEVQFHISSDEEHLEDIVMENTILEKKLVKNVTPVINEKLEEVVDKSKGVNDIRVTTVTSEVDHKTIISKPTNTDLDMTNYEQFDLESLDNRAILMTHDEQNKIKPKSPKIDREILKKQFSANVYIAPIDADVEIFLSITPMDFLFELPVKCEAKRKSPRKSLNIISNRVIKSATTYLKTIENEIQTKSNKNVTLVASDKKEESKDKEMECENIAEQDGKSPLDDDLMNYALIGSERTVDSDELASSDNRKRKRSDLVVEKSIKKKKAVNSEELLKHVDVESFLAKLHGNT